MKVRANKISNVIIPQGKRMSNIQLNNVIKFFVCMLSECAIGYLKCDVSDEDLYPYIRRYFDGEIRAKDLLKRLMENQEIAEYFHAMPDITKAFDNGDWDNVLSNIWIEPDSKNNTYFVEDKKFVTPKLFLNVVMREDGCYAQGYVIDEKEIFFADLDCEEKITEIANPYRFEAALKEKDSEDVLKISEEEFFRIEDIRDSDVDQKSAIKSPVNQNLVVLAGAGSGKTRTLVSRLVYLHLVEGIPLSRMVLLTFTRAASEEMQRRAEFLITQTYEKMNIGKKPYVFAKTFDGFFRRLILDYYVEIGFSKQPTLLIQNNEMKKRSMLKAVVVENQMQGIFTEFLKDDEQIDNLISIMEDYAVGLSVNRPGIDRLLKLFLEKQVEENLVLGFLYTNLIIQDAIKQEHSALAAILQMRYSCVLIDEFQDISMLQNETLRSFYATPMHFTFVGDDDQSIYAWRGADVSIIQSIVNEKNTITKYLMTNYRNNPCIVRAGNCILRLVENRTKQGEIIPYKKQGSKIRIARNDEKYANLVDEIDRLIRTGCNPKEISVLTRKREQAKLITKALKAIGIPVETQDATLKFGVYYELMKCLIHILGEFDLEISCSRLAKLAKEENYTNKEIYDIIRGNTYCESENLALIQRIAEYMSEERNGTLAGVVERYLEKAGEEFDRIPSGNMTNETIEAFIEYCNDVEAPWPITKKQLTSIYAIFEKKSKQFTHTKKMGNGVSVNTIHSAKGLEYDVVMITGLNEGEYPDIGYIDRKYSRKIQELDKLKNARVEYYNLKKNMFETRYQALLADCKNGNYTKDEMEALDKLHFFLAHTKRGIIGLNADTISQFLECYQEVIAPIEKKYKHELAKLSKEISSHENLMKQKEEEIHILKNHETIVAKEDNLKAVSVVKVVVEEENIDTRERIDVEESIAVDESVAIEEAQKQLLQLKEQLEEDKGKLHEKIMQEKLFLNGIANLRAYRKMSYLASGLLADMEKAEEIESIKKELEREKKERVAEERRTFYVAVTRARDHLYLFTDKGATQSEFIKDIDEQLMTEYKAMTKTERKEYEIMKNSLRKEIERKKVDDDLVEEKTKALIQNESFRSYIGQRKKLFFKENTEFLNLPQESAKYIEQAISLLFIGEMTGTEFLPEFAHNMQRAMEVLLEEEAGSEALPFVTEDYRTLNIISEQVRKDASICNTQVPSKRFIEDIMAKDVHGLKDCSLKKIGIMHYIIRSHKFKIRKDVYTTWKKRKLYGDVRDFLKAVIDLSNVRNAYIHKKEKQWPKDAITNIFNDAKIIIKCSRG